MAPSPTRSWRRRFRRRPRTTRRRSRRQATRARSRPGTHEAGGVDRGSPAALPGAFDAISHLDRDAVPEDDHRLYARANPLSLLDEGWDANTVRRRATPY